MNSTKVDIHLAISCLSHSRETTWLCEILGVCSLEEPSVKLSRLLIFDCAGIGISVL